MHLRHASLWVALGGGRASATSAWRQAGATPTPLQVRTVTALLKSGANPDAADAMEGATALHHAAARGDVECIQQLTAGGAGVGRQAKATGLEPLHLAAERGHVEAVQALLAGGAQASAAAGKKGGRCTPLHLAVRGGHVQTVLALLAGGASPNVAAADGTTPLHVAAAGGEADCCVELLAEGANVGAADREGNQPLHTAARCWEGRSSDRFAAVVRALLGAGASPGAQNKKGDTPLALATARGIPQLQRLLLHAMDAPAQQGGLAGWAPAAGGLGYVAGRGWLKGRDGLCAPWEVSPPVERGHRAERSSSVYG